MEKKSYIVVRQEYNPQDIDGNVVGLIKLLGIVDNSDDASDIIEKDATITLKSHGYYEDEYEDLYDEFLTSAVGLDWVKCDEADEVSYKWSILTK
jgi:hypothetical protein